MSNEFCELHSHLLRLSESFLESLSRIQYTSREGSQVSTKEILQSLLMNISSRQTPNEAQIRASIKNFALACALILSARSSKHELLSWIPQSLSYVAQSALQEFSVEYSRVLGEKNAEKIGELGLDSGMMSEEKRLVIELYPVVFPTLKESIKGSSIDKSRENDEILAASAGKPVVYAILAAYQFKWFVTEVDSPHLRKLCKLVIPCALTALDHWSPGVKAQGMISFIHLTKNVNAAEFLWYEDVILDACCHNIASADEIWIHAVEMSVLLVTSIHRNNPRSSWFEKILNEMLSHLEREPRNKERRIAWLRYIEPLFDVLGLFLLAHFRRIFPLIFLWMHLDDDETVLMVLERVQMVIRLTWVRNTPYISRLVDELASLYKESALRKAREEIRSRILHTLISIQQYLLSLLVVLCVCVRRTQTHSKSPFQTRCKGMQFESAWGEHIEDPNLSALNQSLQINFNKDDKVDSDSLISR